jgi:hypothetical protein
LPRLQRLDALAHAACHKVAHLVDYTGEPYALVYRENLVAQFFIIGRQAGNIGKK